MFHINSFKNKQAFKIYQTSYYAVEEKYLKFARLTKFSSYKISYLILKNIIFEQDIIIMFITSPTRMNSHGAEAESNSSLTP